MNGNFSVAIAGAGLSGLCLAQKLTASGLDVRVYERDPTPETRRQGYRITLEEHGITALKRSLPEKLFELAIRTASTPAENGHFVFTNSQLGVVFRLTFKNNPRQIDLTTPRQFDRATLRAILLSGLGDKVVFGKEVMFAEVDKHGVTLRFRNGETVRSGIAVGADGVHSALRDQLLPRCTPKDAGSRAIYGRCPLIVDGLSVVPASLKESGLLALGRPGLAFFFTTMEFGELPEVAFHRSSLGQPAPVHDNYVMWALLFPAEGSPAHLEEMGAEELHKLSLTYSREFHPALRRFIELADRDATVPIKIFAARRPEYWPNSRVALMGDAAHIMPPLGAEGGNTALRDAALLGDRLQTCIRGDQAPEAMIAAYHEEMSSYAYPLVRSSMTQLDRVNMRNALLRWAVLDLLPAIRSIGSKPLLART